MCSCCHVDDKHMPKKSEYRCARVHNQVSHRQTWCDNDGAGTEYDYHHNNDYDYNDGDDGGDGCGDDNNISHISGHDVHYECYDDGLGDGGDGGGDCGGD